MPSCPSIPPSPGPLPRKGGGENGVTPEHLAYVIYTSGSTGQPKGTEVPHRAIPGFFWEVEYARFDERTVLLQHSSTSWDALTLELWPALLKGGTCVLLPAQTSEPALLGEQIREHGVTATWISSAYFNSIVDTTPEVLSGLEQVMIGGEAVSVAHVKRAQALYPGLRIVNGYGPSECTVFTSCYAVPADFDAPVIPIGRPVGDRRVYLLDRYASPVPVGVAGELYVGGPAVARGYLNRPELTAERFVPDPLSGEPGARLYRSGDRVRWRAGGTLEFVGRTDQQVKVRGFRVEPGEVEGVLASHPRVREAAVVVRDDASGAKALVGYAAASEATGAELRAWLRERMPEYMVPAAVVVLDALPLTPHGKTDRRALPAPELSGAAEAYVAPRTPTEEVLAGIWAEVLGVERVGVEESFFELGGHSLLATRLVSRVRGSFGVEIPLQAVFEAPTVAGLAARVEGLLREGGEGGEAPPLVPVPRDRPLPLSFAQQRLWFVDRLEPGSPAYNMPYPLRLRGALDARALERSLAEIVLRHEALRTRFDTAGGEPVQVVDPAGPVALPLRDLRALPEAAREAEVRRLVTEEALRPFDLARGPLLRALLVRLAEEEHALLFTLHHVVSDGWSMGVLTREVSEAYAAFTEGRAPALPELPVQYADYAAWQRGWLRGGTLERHLAWWRERLADAPPLLEIPTDRPRPPVPTERGASRTFRLDPGVSASLASLARAGGATPFMVLLAGFQLLLGRYAGEEDVVVGTPVAGRARAELEPLIGFFVNTLALRTDLGGDPTVRALLGRVREGVLGAFAHQEVPFERLVEELAPERSLAHTPLFQSVFALQNQERVELRMGALEAEPLDGGAETARFDLRLSMVEAEGGMEGSLLYRSDLFDAATAERMVAHLGMLLAEMAADPDRPLSALPAATPAERERMLVEWNATAVAWPEGACVHELFAAQAARTPGAAAVVSGGEVLTYGELDRRTARLARRLRALGVGPDARVALLLERSAELPVGVLGILRAGAAYVPLDPGWPDERLARTLDDAGVPVLVTQAALAARVPSFAGRTVRLDADREALERESAEPLESGAGPDTLAYVIYTSGSTGTPKGVLLEHRGLLNYLRWFDRTVLGEEGFALPLVSRVSFDAHVRQLFPPLLRGEAVWVLPETTVTDPAALLAEVSAHGRASFGGVPSLWSAMLERVRSGEAPRPEGLKAVLLGGEALSPELVERTFALFPGVALWNHYGPTEATVNTTVARVEPGRRVTLGRPIANVRVYLLDRRGNPVPLGAAGELHVAGAGVSRGYLGRPDLTAEKYLPDPFSGEPGARLYRSGDRVRWRADGELEYLGRTDHQVKVRGFRIEPGEVEAALERHPGVREAAVVAQDGPGGARLAGYVVPEDPAPTAAELREWLRERLPEYMVPGGLTVLDAFPLTPNGKVDRRALARMEAPAGDGEAHVAPRGATEEVLAGIFAEVLGVERVGAGDGFFERGGHSLLATRVVSRVRTALGVELPLRAVFEAPTVAGLAARADALLREISGAQAPPLVPVPRDRPLPLSFAQQRLWFVDRLQPGSPAYNMPYRFRLRGALDVRALERSLAEIVRRHESLRTRFATAGEEPVQVVGAAGPVPIPLTDLRGVDAEREVRRLMDEEAARPFDLAAGPLLRTTLVRLADEEWVLLVTLHHAVSDGWSMGVLTREVSEAYAAFTEGRDPDLPELPVQYADYAVWQRGWLSGETLEAQLGWWRERLAGAPPLLELPTDRPRPTTQGERGESVGVALPAETSRALRAIARREGATLFMTLLAAWQLLLSRYVGGGGRVGGHPDRGADAAGDGGADRLLREHAGAAHRPVGRARVPGAAGAGAGDDAGGVPAPGDPLREAGGGDRPGAEPEPHALLPGHVPPGERGRGRRAASGRAGGGAAGAGGRGGGRQVRPDAGAHGRRGRAARGARLPGGAVGARDGRADAGALRRAAGGGAGGPGAAGGGDRLPLLRGARAGAGGVERDGAPVPGGLSRARPVRRAGVADPRRGRGGPRGRAAHLRGAGAPLRPAGERAAPPRGGAGEPGGGLHGPHAGAAGGPARRAARGGRLRAAGPGVPARAAGLHGGGRGDRPGPHRAGAGRAAPGERG